MYEYKLNICQCGKTFGSAGHLATCAYSPYQTLHLSPAAAVIEVLHELGHKCELEASIIGNKQVTLDTAPWRTDIAFSGLPFKEPLNVLAKQLNGGNIDVIKHQKPQSYRIQDFGLLSEKLSVEAGKQKVPGVTKLIQLTPQGFISPSCKDVLEILVPHFHDPEYPRYQDKIEYWKWRVAFAMQKATAGRLLDFFAFKQRSKPFPKRQSRGPKWTTTSSETRKL
jgi:hypothetical protein